MDLQLKNKKVFVSGSTAGIGFAIAKGFAQEGAVVYLNGRDRQKVEKAKSVIELEVPGAMVYGIEADLATTEGYEKLTGQLSDIDILINNLGVFEPVPFFETRDEDWLKMFDINVMSGIRLSRLYMPGMSAETWGVLSLFRVSQPFGAL